MLKKNLINSKLNKKKRSYINTTNMQLYATEQFNNSSNQFNNSSNQFNNSSNQFNNSSNQFNNSSNQFNNSLDQPSYSLNQPSYSLNQPSYSLDQPSYSLNQPSYSSSQQMNQLTDSNNKTNNAVDITKFNKEFKEKDLKEKQDTLKNIDLENNNDIEINILPHQQSGEDIIIGIRDLFFLILELLENGKNPLPIIYGSELRQFYFSLFLIIFGTLLLFLSSLMKSPNEKFL